MTRNQNLKFEPNPDWQANRRSINAQMREYQTAIGEIARMFQRAVMNARGKDKPELKAVLERTKQDLLKLLGEIDTRR
jgi:hypothetical protein